MTGRELIKWILDNDATNKHVMVQLRGDGGFANEFAEVSPSFERFEHKVENGLVIEEVITL